MTESTAATKQFRTFSLMEQLLAGKTLSKKRCAQEFRVTEKSIQRDLEDLRAFFADEQSGKELVYDAAVHGYHLRQDDPVGRLTNSEVLAVCKILLESRSMVKAEMYPILDKLVNSCTPIEELDCVRELIRNERFLYVEPHHGQRFIGSLWDISTAIRDQKELEITYMKMGGAAARRVVQPVGVLFSEYYFYLAAFIKDIDKAEHFANPQDKSPTIYRIDRILEYRITDQRFNVPYKDRFQEGEMRRRIQFMYGGTLQKIRFVYKGPSLEAVLDRLPTAKVTGRDAQGNPVVEAEVFGGSGLDMWLRSQEKWLDPL